MPTIRVTALVMRRQHGDFNTIRYCISQWSQWTIKEKSNLTEMTGWIQWKREERFVLRGKLESKILFMTSMYQQTAHAL